MNPQHPTLPVTSTHNPYEFIVNPVKPPKQSRFSGGGTSSLVIRLAVIIGGAVIVLIIVAVLVNVLFGNKTNAKVFISLAETQTELIRVSDQSDLANDQNVINAATATNLTLTTQKLLMINFLTTHGQKVNPQILVLKKSLSTDKELAAAQAASIYDPTFTRLVVSELQDYNKALNTAYKGATTTAERKLLSSDYSQTQLLIKQWPTPAEAAQPTN